jgi:putative transposase
LIDRKVRKRKKPVGNSWRMDETYIMVNGKWVYLYRAIDSCGDTIEFLLRKRRDAASAKAFFRKAFKSNDIAKKAVIDKSSSTSALTDFNKNLPKEQKIKILQNKYLNNLIEQDHRFIKKRTEPMLGFNSFRSAKITIAGIENTRMIQKEQIIGANNQVSTFENFKMLMAS